MKIKKQTIVLISLILVIVIFLAISIVNNNGGKVSENNVPLEYKEYNENLMSGGPGKDGIPAIENPKYQDVEEHPVTGTPTIYITDGERRWVLLETIESKNLLGD